MLKKVFTTLATYYGNGLYCGKYYCHVNWEILAICRSYCSKWGA